jgi:hypothetical protein
MKAIQNQAWAIEEEARDQLALLREEEARQNRQNRGQQ